MWLLHRKAKEYGQLPSHLRRIANSWAAYQLDNAVLFTGVTIEGALLERYQMGSDSLPRYCIEELLDPDFRLPPKGRSNGGIRAMAAANPGVVGRWKQAPKAV